MWVNDLLRMELMAECLVKLLALFRVLGAPDYQPFFHSSISCFQKILAAVGGKLQHRVHQGSAGLTLVVEKASDQAAVWLSYAASSEHFSQG